MNNFKNVKFIALLAIMGIIISCGKKTPVIVDPPEQENMVDASKMDLEIGNMMNYNDSVQSAVMHTPAHVHHHDSAYHHHDSLYNYHHDHYHHTDTSHHTGWHHTQTQHHQHDSINKAHHIIVH